ncbi:NADH-dependent dehydrogenase [Planctomycetales bacterium]|nr:NADH-dependent dehydrogenase [Planctomycetales bacterium]
MPLSRRRFLEDSLLSVTAAAAAAYGGLCPRLFGEEKVAANDKVGLAVIGSGGRAKDHINAFSNDSRVTILYVVDPDPARTPDKLLDGIADKQGGIRPKRIADMRKAFEDKSVAAISCATTNHWHVLTGIWALQAGKHAYLEKPISHNIYEGEAIIAAQKKYNLIVQTGTQCRSNPANIEAVKFVQGGGIGTVNFARGLCYKRRQAIGALGEYKVPETVDYDLWSGPAPIKPLTRPNFHYDWHWQRLYGNGDMGNQGPHQTDIARWHLGLDRYPNKIITYGGRLGYDVANPKNNDPNYIDAGDTANTEVSVFDFGDKCIVFETRGLETRDLKAPGIQADAKGGGAAVGVIVYGSTGYVVQSAYDYSAAYDLEGNRTKEFKGSGNHYRNFIDAVIANAPDKVTAPARCGALSAALSHLGNISYYLGEKNKVSVEEIREGLKAVKSLDDTNATVDRTVEHLKANGVNLSKTPLSLGPSLEFDPKAVKFVNNADADALMTREYREPYVVPKPEEV